MVKLVVREKSLIRSRIHTTITMDEERKQDGMEREINGEIREKKKRKEK